MNGILIC